MIYFAGPTDAVDDLDSVLSLRGVLGEVAAEVGVSVYFPQSAFVTKAGSVGSEVVQVANDAVLRESGGVIVDLWSSATRFGTLVEVGLAVGLGLPVVALVGSQYRRHLALSQPGVTLVELDDDADGEAVRVAVRRACSLVVDKVGGSRLELQWQLDAGAFGGPEVLAAIDPGDVPPLPSRVYDGDAGFDLPVARRTVVEPGQFVDVPSAYRVAAPEGFWLRITGRSSTLRKYGLLVNESVIDEGWRGPLFAGVRNLGSEVVVLERGMRVAQLVPHRLDAAVLSSVLVDELRPGDRGESGFGSTGA